MTTTLGAPVQALPAPRGPLSEALADVLVGGRPTADLPSRVGDVDPFGEDVQLALHLCYELHYRPTQGVDDALEWDPDVLRLRRALEAPFLAALRDAVPAGDDVDAVLEPLLLEPTTGTGPSWHLRGAGTLDQLRENVVHRSVYHRKEADPQTWVVPRLAGQAKASLVSVQHDEYGAGRGDRMHEVLFAAVMEELDLDPSYGAYVDAVPAPTLAVTNLMSLLGLHRRWRGASVGLFAALEVTSSPGSRRLSQAFARLLPGDSAGRRFYDEHVEADAVHEQVLRHGILRDLLQQEPALAADVVFGMSAWLHLEDVMAAHVVGAWSAGRSSLRSPL